MVTEKDIKQLTSDYAKEVIVDDGSGDTSAMDATMDAFEDGANFAKDNILSAARDYANSTVVDPDEHPDAVYDTMVDYLYGVIRTLEKEGEYIYEKMQELGSEFLPEDSEDMPNADVEE